MQYVGHDLMLKLASGANTTPSMQVKLHERLARHTPSVHKYSIVTPKAIKKKTRKPKHHGIAPPGGYEHSSQVIQGYQWGWIAPPLQGPQSMKTLPHRLPRR